MSDRVETRQKPWFGLRHGVTVLEGETVLTATEMIERAKLNWTVNKVPMTVDFKGTGIEVPGLVALQRDKDGAVLGVCSPKYQPIQNVDSFDWLDAITDSGEAKYECAASLCGGSVVMIVAAVPKHINLLGLDEHITFYLMVVNSFDQSYKFSCSITPIRAECYNMMNMALSSAPRQWSIKHRKNALDKLQQARETLGLTFQYIDEYEKVATTLAKTKYSNDDFDELLDHISPYPARDKSKENDRAFTEVENRRALLRATFVSASNLANVRGTAWAAWNAVGEYADWDRRVYGKSTVSDNENDRIKADNMAMRQLLDYSMKDKSLRFIADQKKVAV